jgi:hypothetical protein
LYRYVLRSISRAKKRFDATKALVALTGIGPWFIRLENSGCLVAQANAPTAASKGAIKEGIFMRFT